MNEEAAARSGIDPSISTRAKDPQRLISYLTEDPKISEAAEEQCGTEIREPRMGEIKCTRAAGHTSAHMTRRDDLTYTWGYGERPETTTG